MKILFWKTNKVAQDKIQAIDAAALKTHEKTLETMHQAKQNSDKLKAVLKKNNITIELAKAMGH